MLRPTTAPGRWAILAVAGFVTGMAVFALMVAAGQRGGDEFFDNLWLTVPVLAAYVAAVLAFVCGATAIVRSGERSLAVIVATVLGLGVTSFGVLEVLFPH